MTLTERNREREITYTTRINILCPAGEAQATEEQKRIASDEAEEHLAALEREEKLACVDDEGHEWRSLGTAKDGTGFVKCVRCGREEEE
jgi:hypothetical protein